MRVLGRGLAVLLFAMLVVGAGPQTAQAHAELLGSDPAAGVVLVNPPTTVRLWFNAGIAPNLSTATLVDGSGARVPGTRPAVDPADPRSLTLELPTLPDGGYAVLWQVLAEDDGHTTSGVVVFSVGASISNLAAVASSAAGSTSLLEVVLRWLGLFFLTGAVGGLAVAGVVLRRASTGPELRRPARWAQGRILGFAFSCARAAVVVSVAILFEEAVRATSPSGATWWTTGIARVLALSRWGHLWIAREIALVAFAMVLSLMASVLRRHDGQIRKGSFAAAGILVIAIVWIQALGSHAAALASGRSLAIAADAVHLLTACLWLGALPALVLVLRAGGAEEGPRTALLRACAVPFSLLAGTSVCLVVVTGLYSAGREVDTVGGLTGTSYGHALLAKSALLVLAAALGALNAVRLHGWVPRRRGGGARLPAAGSSPSRRIVVIETGVGLSLLLLVGVLTATPPARGPTLARAPEATRTEGRSVEDLVVSLSVSPDRPGVNGFTVVAESSRRPPPAAIDTVALEIAGDRTELIFLKEVEPGRYFGTANLDDPGRVRLTTMIERAGDQFSVPFRWSVASTAGTVLVQPQGRRLAPLVDGLAVAVLVVAMTAGVLLVMKRRRGVRAGATPAFVLPTESVQAAESKIPEVVS